MTIVTTDSLSVAADQFWRPAGLDAARLNRVLESSLARGADFSDLYFQHVTSESWTLEDGSVKDGSFRS